MLNDQRALDYGHDHEDEVIRDIHALTPPHPQPLGNRAGRRRETWETSSHRSSSLSISSTTDGASSENFTSISREFNALVLAGSAINHHNGNSQDVMTSTNNNNNSNLSRIGEENNNNNLSRIREEDVREETNPWAIVPDNTNQLEPQPAVSSSTSIPLAAVSSLTSNQNEVSVQRLKKEEIESKINAWQTAKIAKINNRFKREDAIINGRENEKVQKATLLMKKVERKLEEKRARALEKMQNKIAGAHRKAEERRASAEAKRGTKVAKILEVANLMKAVGRAPVKRSFF